MIVLRRLVFLFGTCFVCAGHVYGQTEQQLTAELLWAYASTAEFGEQVQEAADALTATFPQSANAAAWVGTLRAIGSDQQTGFVELNAQLTAILARHRNEPLYTLVEKELNEVIRHTKKKTTELEKLNSRVAADIAFLQAIELDKHCFAAWAGLLKSEQIDVALRASNAWAELDKSNALPLYARANLLHGVLKNNEGLTEGDKKRLRDEIVDTLEAGNRRPGCTLPRLPFPQEFEIEFDARWDGQVPGCLGKQVPYAFLRKTFDVLPDFGWFNSSPLSGGTFRRLLTDSVRSCVHSSDEHQVTHLNRLLRLSSHLLRSNSNDLAIGANPHLAFARLEVLAAAQEDFDAVDRYREFKEHLTTTRRQVADSYLAQTKPNDDADDTETLELVLSNHYFESDRDAAEIMAKRPKPPELPEVQFRKLPVARPEIVAGEIGNQKIPSNTMASTALVHSSGVDYVRFDIYADEYYRLVASGSPTVGNRWDRQARKDKLQADGKLHIKDLEWDDIKAVAHQDSYSRVCYVDQLIQLLFDLNRTARRNVGVYLVLQHVPWPFDELGSLQDSFGLLSKEDRFVVATRDESHLQQIHQWERSFNTAWIVSFERLQSLSAEELGEFVEARREFLVSVAIDLAGKPAPAEDLTRVVRTIKSHGVSVHLFDVPNQPLPDSVKEAVNMIVTRFPRDYLKGRIQQPVP